MSPSEEKVKQYAGGCLCFEVEIGGATRDTSSGVDCMVLGPERRNMLLLCYGEDSMPRLDNKGALSRKLEIIVAYY